MEEITNENLINLLMKKFPKFISYWESFVQDYGADNGIYIQILSFVGYVVDVIKSQDQQEIKNIFDFIEFLMCQSNEKVQNLIATGFLEGLLNYDPDDIQFAKFSKYLGKETIAYLRAWNEFNGTHTEGI